MCDGCVGCLESACDPSTECSTYRKALKKWTKWHDARTKERGRFAVSGVVEPRRMKIFSATIRGQTAYLKAVDIEAAFNLLTQFDVPFKELEPAPGNSRRAKLIREIAIALRMRDRNRRNRARAAARCNISGGNRTDDRY